MNTHPLKRIGGALMFAALISATGCKDLEVETDKQQYQFGESATMWLLFKDDRVPDGEGSFSWKSNRDGEIGNGSTITLASLSAGNHEIKVQGTYKGKKAKSKTKKLTITNEKPRAIVHAPLGSPEFPVGSTVEFVGAANDLEDGQLTGQSLAWTSSIDGALGYGSTVTRTAMNPGTHRITLSATDAAGSTGSTSFNLEITNQAPQARIQSPGGDLTINVMENLSLRGSATDPDPVTGTASIPASRIVWRSDKDGELGRGFEVNVSDLSGGTHRIELQAADEYGEIGKASVKVTVINQPPTARITSPGNNQYYSSKDTISFFVDARDPETSLDENKIVWRSNHDGRIGRGFRFDTDDLSPNEHRITVEVTDKHGATAKAEVKVLVTNEAPVAQISEPLNGSRFRFGETVELNGSAVDREDGNVSSSNFEWSARNLTTGRDYDLGSGNDKDLRVRTLVDRLRGFGEVEITLVAKDDDGTESQPAKARITLVNREPTVRIATPTMGDQLTSGTEVTFTGFAQDPDRDEFLKGNNMIWTARQGPSGQIVQLGRGERVKVSTLAPGRYQVTLTAIDPDDNQLRATATVRIRVAPAAPVTASTSTGTASTGSTPVGVGIHAVVNASVAGN